MLSSQRKLLMCSSARRAAWILAGAVRGFGAPARLVPESLSGFAGVMLSQCVRYHRRASPMMTLSRRSASSAGRFLHPSGASRRGAPEAVSSVKSRGRARAWAAVASLGKVGSAGASLSWGVVHVAAGGVVMALRGSKGRRGLCPLGRVYARAVVGGGEAGGGGG